MDTQVVTGAVISTDAQFRAALRQHADAEQPVEVGFEIVVPFVEISHGHLSRSTCPSR
ncbi:MAG: hypothetical protein LC799_01300 [Actinobacteria bacterium]|nr:hypothetical protein [Actinomycetota bacterium]